MDLRNRSGLKHAASQALSAASYSPKKLVLIHTCVTLGIMLFLVLVNFMVEHQIGDTGGLSGLGMRSMLQTVRWGLQVIQLVAIPFWEVGYFWAAMHLAREEQAEPKDLLEGFRLFGPVLRHMLLKSVIFAGIGIACLYFSTQIFLVSPLSNKLFETMEPYMADSSILESGLKMSETAVLEMERAILPLFAIFGIVYVLISLPIMYSYRMSTYCLLDNPKKGAFAAMRRSRQLMRYNKIDLFKLDLSFWWYYLLNVLLGVLCYGDMLLKIAGIAAPWSDAVGFFAFYALFLIGQLLLYYLARNQVETTYVLAYDTLYPSESRETEV